MKRWDCRISKEVENEKIDNFLKDIVRVYKKHNLSLSHEDCHGSFEIENINVNNIEWIGEANISIEYKE